LNYGYKNQDFSWTFLAMSLYSMGTSYPWENQCFQMTNQRRAY